MEHRLEAMESVSSLKALFDFLNFEAGKIESFKDKRQINKDLGTSFMTAKLLERISSKGENSVIYECARAYEPKRGKLISFGTQWYHSEMA